ERGTGNEHGGDRGEATCHGDEREVGMRAFCTQTGSMRETARLTARIRRMDFNAETSPGIGVSGRAFGVVVAGAAVLVLPLSLLLFLQWPLREWVQMYSREANDLAQILFAFYVAVAITAATRAHAHLATDLVARRLSARVRTAVARFASLAVL